MKQLNFFDTACDPEELPKPHGGAIWKVFIDGASRKNPGIAGAGVYIIKNDELVQKKGFFLGIKTNNQAEYFALLLGIFLCKQHMNKAHDSIVIISDSELLVKHCTGEYKLRNPELRHLFTMAFAMLEGLSYSFCHVLREKNTNADAMANEGIDKKRSIPQDFLTLLRAHGITL